MKYITAQGDMWDSIAHKFYGDVNRIDVLISANPEHRKVYIFSAGTEIEIPEIEEKTIPSGLPPWKNASG